MITQMQDALLRKMVHEKLLQKLKTGELKPGSLVRIKKLAEELEISRTPLRDALLQLQVEGFVTLLPQRGVVINELTEEEKGHIYEVCGALDYQVMISVFADIKASHLLAMEEINERILKCSVGADRSEFNTCNFDFHSVYLGLSSNSIVKNLLNTYRTRLFHFTDQDWGDDFYTVNYNEHCQLIELIRQGDRVAAAEFLRDTHWSFNW